MDELVKIQDLDIRFYTYEGVVKAVDKISLDILPGETLGLVGETGCGKTVTALSLLGLVLNPGKIEGGSIVFNDGEKSINLTTLNESRYRRIRGSLISMIFQEPSAALNPVYTIGDQISEVILLHRRSEVTESAIQSLSQAIDNSHGIFSLLLQPVRILQEEMLKQSLDNPDGLLWKILLKIPLVRKLYNPVIQEANKMAVQALRDVDIPDAARIVKQYPHEMSGGMKQRVVIAIALACNPRLLIADEPTTSLDVTIQFQILQLLRKLKAERNSSTLYITHDLAVAAEICDRIGVMYAGSLCEIASVQDIFKNASHPYTLALLDAVPKPGIEPKAVGGFLPDPVNLPKGCKFNPRCPNATEQCSELTPGLTEIAPGHFVACHNQQGT